ncbi:MAG: hypothetical protein QM817_29635 [Archangium sp.]
MVGDDELPPSLLEACDSERLLGGLSISRRATPDELAVWLANAMGGRAKQLRVLDVRGEFELEVQCGSDLHEKWKVADVHQLIARLNETFCDDEGVKWLVELGEFEGSWQVWALAPEVVDPLLATSLLAAALNRRALEALFDDDDE